MIEKNFKNLDEQVEILKHKGMIVNDEKYANEYAGVPDGEKKASFLRDKCSKYNIVKFVDDDHKNLAAMRALKIPNLKVIEAQGIEHNKRILNKENYKK